MSDSPQLEYDSQFTLLMERKMKRVSFANSPAVREFTREESLKKRPLIEKQSQPFDVFKDTSNELELSQNLCHISPSKRSSSIFDCLMKKKESNGLDTHHNKDQIKNLNYYVGDHVNNTCHNQSPPPPVDMSIDTQTLTQTPNKLNVSEVKSNPINLNLIKHAGTCNLQIHNYHQNDPSTGLNGCANVEDKNYVSKVDGIINNVAVKTTDISVDMSLCATGDEDDEHDTLVDIQDIPFVNSNNNNNNNPKVTNIEQILTNNNVSSKNGIDIASKPEINCQKGKVFATTINKDQDLINLEASSYIKFKKFDIDSYIQGKENPKSTKEAIFVPDRNFQDHFKSINNAMSMTMVSEVSQDDMVLGHTLFAKSPKDVSSTSIFPLSDTLGSAIKLLQPPLKSILKKSYCNKAISDPTISMVATPKAVRNVKMTPRNLALDIQNISISINKTTNFSHIHKKNDNISVDQVNTPKTMSDPTLSRAIVPPSPIVAENGNQKSLKNIDIQNVTATINKSAQNCASLRKDNNELSIDSNIDIRNHDPKTVVPQIIIDSPMIAALKPPSPTFLRSEIVNLTQSLAQDHQGISNTSNKYSVNFFNKEGKIDHHNKINIDNNVLPLTIRPSFLTGHTNKTNPEIYVQAQDVSMKDINLQAHVIHTKNEQLPSKNVNFETFNETTSSEMELIVDMEFPDLVDNETSLVIIPQDIQKAEGQTYNVPNLPPPPPPQIKITGVPGDNSNINEDIDKQSGYVSPDDTACNTAFLREADINDSMYDVASFEKNERTILETEQVEVVRPTIQPTLICQNSGETRDISESNYTIINTFHQRDNTITTSYSGNKTVNTNGIITDNYGKTFVVSSTFDFENVKKHVNQETLNNNINHLITDSRDYFQSLRNEINESYEESNKHLAEKACKENGTLTNETFKIRKQYLKKLITLLDESENNFSRYMADSDRKNVDMTGLDDEVTSHIRRFYDEYRSKNRHILINNDEKAIEKLVFMKLARNLEDSHRGYYETLYIKYIETIKKKISDLRRETLNQIKFKRELLYNTLRKEYEKMRDEKLRKREEFEANQKALIEKLTLEDIHIKEQLSKLMIEAQQIMGLNVKPEKTINQVVEEMHDKLQVNIETMTQNIDKVKEIFKEFNIPFDNPSRDSVSEETVPEQNHFAEKQALLKAYKSKLNCDIKSLPCLLPENPEHSLALQIWFSNRTYLLTIKYTTNLTADMDIKKGLAQKDYLRAPSDHWQISNISWDHLVLPETMSLLERFICAYGKLSFQALALNEKCKTGDQSTPQITEPLLCLSRYLTYLYDDLYYCATVKCAIKFLDNTFDVTGNPKFLTFQLIGKIPPHSHFRVAVKIFPNFHTTNQKAEFEVFKLYGEDDKKEWLTGHLTSIEPNKDYFKQCVDVFEDIFPI